jgi:predicted dehydrogenase
VGGVLLAPTLGALPQIVPARALGSDGQTSPANKITVGVLGVGAQGQYDLRSFLACDDVRVRAICDVNQKNLAHARRLIAEQYGSPDVKVYTDFRELNADPEIDAVLMALPVHWHSIPALDAVLHGKHIYHEKPVAMSVGEARLLRQAVLKKGVVFQFGTQQRSDLKFRWACELALNGRLGKVQEILVSVPAGRRSERLPEQSLPDYVDWDRWVGPAPATSFHENKLQRDWHENITNFSLGMISCWGIHHLDIAQWGNGADATGPCTVEGTGEFPGEGTCDAILRWKVRFEYADRAPITFVSSGQGIENGVRFVGDKAWVFVTRGEIRAGDDQLLRDPQNKYDQMPIQLPISNHHTRNFIDAVKHRTRAICDVEAAVRGDTLCQLALLAVKQGRKLRWDPQAERFVDDEAASQLLLPRPFRGSWRLPEIG